MANRAVLILYIPVIHRGYLNLLQKVKKKVDLIYILDNKLIKSLSKYEPDIAGLPPSVVKTLLEKLGYRNVEVLSGRRLQQRREDIKTKQIYLINDDVSKNLAKKYFSLSKIEWLSVFLRWDRTKVISSRLPSAPVSTIKADKYFMKLAYRESEKSSDWWRRVGAVLVKNKKVIFKTYNQGLPTDHSPYIHGGIRDYLEIGENPELSPTIHAEQLVVSNAARLGTSLNKTALYVTHFPCSLCAKIIASSGISNLFFSEGSANLHALQVLQSSGIKLKIVKPD